MELRLEGARVVSEWDADEAVTRLYAAHYRSLVRLAALLVHDVDTAEEVVQDAFVAMHGRWRRLREPDKALPYLRTTVLNRSRSVLRHRKVVAAQPVASIPDAPSAEATAMGTYDSRRMLDALAELPRRQREVVVLRYYADLSEHQIAEAMGISPGAVKSHASRALASLRVTMGGVGHE